MGETSSNENPLAEGLMSERRAEPCTVVIFGASGDLTLRKLVPALFNLAAHDHLPQRYAIVGVARRPMGDDKFRAQMADGVRSHSRTKPRSEGEWADFEKRLFYHPLSFDDPAAYSDLRERLKKIQAELGLPPNVVFYLATAPSSFPIILEMLRDHRLVLPPGSGEGWQRVVVEKPFGKDLASARALNHTVAQTLDESQAYRIDHYLGKETVQNMMTFRFANTIFEPLWNRENISSVQITAAETVGMESGRGGYYDHAGAMRDMIQNHLMQLLCLTAMEPPSRLDATAVRNEKVKVLRTLNPMTPEQVAANVVRGQYSAGSVMGKKVPGYREEDGVAADSITETYVAMRLTIDNWRWAGVPFLLRSGKRLPKRVTEIAIRFRVPPVGLFRKQLGGADDAFVSPNLLLLQIQPDEGISLTFDAKAPGMKMRLQPVKMDFRYGSSFGDASPEAYERLLLDAIVGDSTLFTRNDEVEAAWEVITSIHKGWEAGPRPELPNYEAGTWGPEAAEKLFRPGEGSWRRL